MISQKAFMKKLLLAVLCSFSLQLIYSQKENEPSFCGTVDNFEINTLLEEFQKNPNSYTHLKSLTDTIYVPIVIHIIGDDFGGGYYADSEVRRAFCELNQQFEQTGIQFFVKHIRYHNNTTWYNHESYEVGSEITAATLEAGAMNCYIDNFAAGACGYAYLSSNIMFLRKSCIGPGSHTWAHEMGHAFSLPHTFRGWERERFIPGGPAPRFVRGREVELVERTNCTNAGDGFCDTDADYISNRWQCNPDQESNLIQTDPNGVEFRSKGYFIMGYANDACMSVFSDQQIQAMRLHNLANNAHFIEFDMQYKLSSPTVELIYPENSAEVSHLSSQLTWSSVRNNSGYLLQVSRSFAFVNYVVNDIIFDTTFTLSELQPNRNYYWRVMPYSDKDICTRFTEVQNFRPVVQTSIHELEGMEVNVYPNPVSFGQDVLIDFSGVEHKKIILEVKDLSGKTIQQRTVDLFPGRFQASIPTTNLPSSMYFLQISTESARLTTKFVVN
jgi:hypothetical protein